MRLYREVRYLDQHGRPFTIRSGCGSPSWCCKRGLEDYSVGNTHCTSGNLESHCFLSFSALSEVLGITLPYDDVLHLRDRMWEIAPSLVRYDHAEPTTSSFTSAGLDTLARQTGVSMSGAPIKKPIANFYQTDPISRAYVIIEWRPVTFTNGGFIQFGDHG
jgi:hypothetical protein